MKKVLLNLVFLFALVCFAEAQELLIFSVTIWCCSKR